MAEAEKPTKGRGGKGNFPNSRAGLIQTDEDRQLVKRLLGETLDAYRQPKVKTDDELAARIDDYFAHCADTGQTPTVEELYLYIGYAYSTVYDWETGRTRGLGPETSGIIKKAKSFMRTFDAKLVVSGKMNFLAYCFRAKNYYGMVDKVEHEVITTIPTLTEQVNRAELEKELLAEGIDVEAED